MDFLQLGAKVGIYFVPFLFSLSFHEFAHGWMAKRKGDRTAEILGRLTLNPFAHADPIGTFVLPLSAIIWGIPFFGWAKPVPVDERNFKHPRKDMFWVAAAGPLSNVLLAITGAILMAGAISVMGEASTLRAVIEFFKVFIIINLFLAFFNMIPVHPLDGGKVLARFLPEEINRKLENNQQILSMLLLVLFISGALRVLATPVYWVYGQLISLVEMLVV